MGTLRAGQLRKMLRDRFGPTAAEGALATLWRAAPATEGSPQPAEDQSQLLPGLRLNSPHTSRWIQELNDPHIAGQAWLAENGLWCG